MVVRKTYLVAAVLLAMVLMAPWEDMMGGPVCSRKEWATRQDVDSMPNCFISGTYFEARSLFLNDVERFVQARNVSHSLDHLEVADGLYIDILKFPGNTESVLLHISGTHGTEGFIGDGIQRAILSSLDDTILQKPETERPTIVLIHILNPFGMANFRRWNENNVDLNRNAIFNEEGWAEVLSRKLNDFGYEHLDPYLNAKGHPFWSTFLFSSLPNALWSAFWNDVDIKHAVCAAQYIKQEAIAFGGKGLQKSHELVGKWLVDSGLPQTVKRVGIIDIHSGLGPMGKDTLMIEVGPRHLESVFKKHTFDEPRYPYFTTEFVQEEIGKNSASDGYQDTRGDVCSANAYMYLFPHREEQYTFGVTQEFGTFPSLFVALSGMLENQAWHHAEGTPEEQRQTKARFGLWNYFAFLPQFGSTRSHALGRGLVVFRQVYDYLSFSK